jgi:hypothetical protein
MLLSGCGRMRSAVTGATRPCACRCCCAGTILLMHHAVAGCRSCYCYLAIRCVASRLLMLTAVLQGVCWSSELLLPGDAARCWHGVQGLMWTLSAPLMCH